MIWSADQIYQRYVKNKTNSPLIKFPFKGFLIIDEYRVFLMVDVKTVNILRHFKKGNVAEDNKKSNNSMISLT